MNVAQKVEHWSDTHHSLVMDGLRIILGLFLLFKGIAFGADTKPLQEMMGQTFNYVPVFIVHYVAFAHLVGGLFITLGLLTRWAAGFQIPVLIGAVFFNLMQGFSTVNSEFWISTIVLILLVVFLFYGSGLLSVDNYMKTHMPEDKFADFE